MYVVQDFFFFFNCDGDSFNHDCDDDNVSYNDDEDDDYDDVVEEENEKKDRIVTSIINWQYILAGL